MIEFQWRLAKPRANLKKHGVSFDEAQSVFYDDYARQYYDDEHSKTEDRFILLGMSIHSRVLVVCHCERSSGDAIRIISARKATSKERNNYQGPMR